MSKLKIGIGFLAGILLSLLVFFAWKGFTKKNEDKSVSDYYIITNQISKMNKMVVMEQNLSMMQKTTISHELFGSSYLPSSDKHIITFTKTNVQVSYDLSKMKIKVDSLNKKLIIETLPQPKITIIPSVEIQSMDDSFYNRFSQKDIKHITQKAKDAAYKMVDQEKLKEAGKKQLISNLKEIFVLAKVLNYKVVDNTNEIPLDLY